MSKLNEETIQVLEMTLSYIGQDRHQSDAIRVQNLNKVQRLLDLAYARQRVEDFYKKESK